MSKLIAHRGASLLALENTEKAFTLAAENTNVYGIETDVWLTLDNVWVCSHDSNPFADKNIHIYQANYQDIQALPLIIPKAKYQTLVPSYICTLDKYLDICQNYNKAPIIELKQPNLTELQLINLLTKVKTSNLFTSSSFISFNFSTLDLLKKIDPQTITYNLIDSKFNQNGLGKRGIIEAINSQCNVSIRAILASQRMIDLIHAHKLLVSIWTVDKQNQGQKYQKRGVDFITSNEITLLNR